MREIKFRAWNIDRKTWAISDELLGVVPVSANLIGVPSVITIGKPDDEWVFQQFIGIHDDNGKDIYEGDIVKFRSHPKPTKIAEVAWSEPYSRFCLRWFDNDLEREKNYPSTHNFGHENTLEVIGNIYENADLLK